MSYLATQYGEQRQPSTGFPDALVAYLMGLGLVGSDALLLEVGAGRGDFAKAWGRALKHAVHAVDREDAGTLHRLRLADVQSEELPYLSASFDVVFSKSLIEHLSDPGQFLDQALRVLRPGGRLILMTPDWRTYMRTFYDDYTHVRPYDQVSLADLLAAHGFADARCDRIWQYPPLWRWPCLRPAAVLWRWLVPVELSLRCSRWTGCGFFRWSSQLTLLATATKR